MIKFSPQKSNCLEQVEYSLMSMNLQILLEHECRAA